MRIVGERAYLLKCVDRLLGLAGTCRIPVKGYAVMMSGGKFTAFVSLGSGTDMETVKKFCRDGQKCFRAVILSVGSTGPDSRYPTIFIQRIPHIK